MDLSRYRNDDFDRGASRAKELIWLIVSALFVAGPIPGSKWRILLLRIFGAKIEAGVVIKMRVQVKFPWRLVIGQNSWIGEGVWIDNLATVHIGQNVCISQGVYICTGNHDWTKSTFDLMVSGVVIEDQCWVGARATVAPGTYMHEGAILGLGALGRGSLKPWTIYAHRLPEAVSIRSRARMESAE